MLPSAHWSYQIQYLVLAIFMSLMVYVTYISYDRQSGSTGLDMSKIQQIRYDASYGQEKNQELSLSEIELKDNQVTE